MNSIECSKQKIRAIIAKSSVPEDPLHAENTLEWLLKLDPKADIPLQIAALGHDIERAVETQKVHYCSYNDYDAFKTAHAYNGAKILRGILEKCGITMSIIDETCRLVTLHEFGGDPRSDLLKDVDSISFFDVNLPLYYQREGWDKTVARCIWGYKRLSESRKKFVRNIKLNHRNLTCLLKQAFEG